MILAIDRNGAIFVFASAQEAERHLEAIDVKQDAFEFCDTCGQRYLPAYTRQPRETRIGPFASVDIGAFRLDADGDIDVRLAESFVGRASHLEHSLVPSITSIETLRNELHKRG
jgi:hypothetical protein